MTGVMHLDLGASRDEGLLVPFGKTKEDPEKDNHHNPLYAPPPVYRQNGLGFFRRRERRNTKQSEREPEEEDMKNVKRQIATFSFPSAPQAFADEEQVADAFLDNPAVDPSLKQSKQPDNKKEESSDEESSSEEDDEKNEKKRENRPPPRRQTRDGMNAAPTNSFRRDSPSRSNQENNGLTQEDPSKRLNLEGYGNSKPEQDTPMSAMSRMFRRISKRSDMKSMKIATEDTKDDRTFGETVTHCVQVALVPEVYAEDIEGEGNLGFYRPISRVPPRDKKGPPTSQQRVLDSVSKWKKENILLKKKVVALRDHVEKLEENIKTKDLEAAVWKLRAQELEEELRQSRGKDDDNSTTESRKVGSDGDEESESGIDHEWTEKQASNSAVKEDVLVDTTFVPKKISFDPMEAPEKTLSLDQDQGDEETESEAGENEPERGCQDESATEVQEEVLIDTSIVSDPVVFDPMKESMQDDDGGTEDKLLDLITSLSADVEVSAETKAEQPEEKEGTEGSTEAEAANETNMN